MIGVVVFFCTDWVRLFQWHQFQIALLVEAVRGTTECLVCLLLCVCGGGGKGELQLGPHQEFLVGPGKSLCVCGRRQSKKQGYCLTLGNLGWMRLRGAKDQDAWLQ